MVVAEIQNSGERKKEQCEHCITKTCGKRQYGYLCGECVYYNSTTDKHKGIEVLKVNKPMA